MDDYAGNSSTTGVVVPGTPITGVLESRGDSDWFQFDLVAGTSYEIFIPQDFSVGENFLDASGSPLYDVVDTNIFVGNGSIWTINADVDQTVYFHVIDRSESHPASYSYDVTIVDNNADDHANGADASATDLVIGDNITGQIGSITDQDAFEVTLNSTSEYTFVVPEGLHLNIFDSGGITASNRGLYEHNIDPDTGEQTITYQPFMEGTYYLRVEPLGQSLNYPVSYDITTAQSHPFEDIQDNSDSTLANPDDYEIGVNIIGEGNYGDFPDYEYYDFTVTAGDVVFFDTIYTGDDGFFSYSIIDSSGNVLDPNFSPFITNAFSELAFSAAIFRFEEDGDFTLITRAISSLGESDVPFEFLLQTTAIPDYTVPDAIQDLYGEDTVLWFPTLGIGGTPTIASIGTSQQLYRLTAPDGSFDENLSHTVNAGETMYADNSSLIFSDVGEGFVVNNGTMWSYGGTTAIGGSNLAYFDNNGLFVALGEFSATGMNFAGNATLHNNGTYFVFTEVGSANGFQASGSDSHHGDGLNYNTGSMISQSMTGQARAVFFKNDSNFNNSGSIIVDGFSNALAIVMGGEVINSGSITATVGSLARLSVGITSSSDGYLSSVANSGTITADITLLMDPYSNVENSGTLNGDVIFLSGSFSSNDPNLTDDLINTGIINGDVEMGNAISIYNGTNGVVFGTISLGGGDDIALGGHGSDVFIGGLGDDIIDGGAGDDLTYGGSGDDILNGDVGNDVLYGGLGNDVVNGGAGRDTLIGQDGNDILSGGGSADTLSGGADDDTLNGDSGTDILRGQSGDDTINGGDGADLITGQYGADTINGDAGNDNIFAGFGEDLVFGGSGDDTIRGEGQNDELHGGDGDDLITGGGNRDTIFGDADNDSLFGQGGLDIIHGGTGNDTLSGGTGNDVLFGDEDDDMLIGSSGNDTLNGGSGRDTLFGGDNNDVLFGNSGEDTLSGNDGNDILNGGSGRDILNGGTGSDIFVFGQGFERDSVNGFANDVDTLTILGSEFGIDTIAELLDPANGHVTQVDANTVRFDFGAGDIFIINGESDFTIADLTDDVLLG